MKITKQQIENKIKILEQQYYIAKSKGFRLDFLSTFYLLDIQQLKIKLRKLK